MNVELDLIALNDMLKCPLEIAWRINPTNALRCRSAVLTTAKLLRYFVRVIYLATGIERLHIGYNGSTPKEISSRMELEIISELRNKLTDQST